MGCRIEDQGKTLAVTVQGVTHRFNRFWLRDLCPSLPPKESGLRTFSVAELPVDLMIASAAIEADTDVLTVAWSDDHHSDYKIAELAQLAPKARGERPAFVERELFDSSFDPPIFEFAGLAAGSIAHHDLLAAVTRHGMAIVDNIDDTDESTETLAALLGRIRETDYGRVFSIVTEPDTWTLSQSSKGQDPHSDDPFRYAPSGISILHCRTAATGDGGASVITDALKVAQDLRDENPQAFALLAGHSIPYTRYRDDVVDQGEDVNMVAYGPVITTNGDDIVGIRFHERSTAVFDLAPDITDAYYLAFRAFAEKVRSADYQFVRRLLDGQAIVFDNQRVLHGRRGYETDTGRRHLRLCSVDRDQVHSRLRRLKEIHGLPGVAEALPAGAQAW